jgi:hypothetical protein
LIHRDLQLFEEFLIDGNGVPSVAKIVRIG